MPPVGLLAEVHGDALRVLTRCAGIQLQGLRQGERLLRDRLSSKSRRRLIAVDLAFSVFRHLTAEGCKAFLAELQKDLSLPELIDDVNPCDAAVDPWAAAAASLAPAHAHAANDAYRETRKSGGPYGDGHAGSEPDASLTTKMRRRASGTSVCSGAYGGTRKEDEQEETKRQDFYIGDYDDAMDLQLEDAPAQRSDIRRQVCFADETAEHPGQQASLEDVMSAILALREDYAQHTNMLAVEVAELSQRVGFDEAQARAAERALAELRVEVDKVRMALYNHGPVPGQVPPSASSANGAEDGDNSSDDAFASDISDAEPSSAPIPWAAGALQAVWDSMPPVPTPGGSDVRRLLCAEMRFLIAGDAGAIRAASKRHAELVLREELNQLPRNEPERPKRPKRHLLGRIGFGSGLQPHEYAW